MPHSNTPEEVHAATLSVLAFHALSTFELTSTDSQHAPSIRESIGLARLAGHSLEHFERLASQVADLGGDLTSLMESQAGSFRAFRERTRPKDWYESVMKVYVYDGIMTEYCRSTLTALDSKSREVVDSVFDDTRSADYLRECLRSVVSDDEVIGSRLALWGRKLVAESLTRIREFAAIPNTVFEKPDEALLQRLLAGHSKRMSDLGLTA